MKVSVLDLACSLAALSAAARHRERLDWYLFAAVALAAGPRVGVNHRAVARA